MASAKNDGVVPKSEQDAQADMKEQFKTLPAMIYNSKAQKAKDAERYKLRNLQSEAGTVSRLNFITGKWMRFHAERRFRLEE